MKARMLSIGAAVLVGLALLALPALGQTQVPDTASVRWDSFWRVSQLGGNYGYASTTDEANAAFGDGREWTIFVNQRAWKVFGGRIAYGNISLGEAEDFEKAYLTAIDLFGQSYSAIALTVEYFALGPSLHLDPGVRHGLTLSGAYGWYTIILDLTDTRGRSFVPRTRASGWMANAAYSFWPWEKTSFRFEVDYHSIDTNPSNVDFYNLFTDGEDPTVWSYQFGIGYAYGNIFK